MIIILQWKNRFISWHLHDVTHSKNIYYSICPDCSNSLVANIQPGFIQDHLRIITYRWRADISIAILNQFGSHRIPDTNPWGNLVWTSIPAIYLKFPLILIIFSNKFSFNGSGTNINITFPWNPSESNLLWYGHFNRYPLKKWHHQENIN